jgi:hypothetical protein
MIHVNMHPNVANMNIVNSNVANMNIVHPNVIDVLKVSLFM